MANADFLGAISLQKWNRVFCSACGRQIPSDSLLCPYCGRQLERPPTPTGRIETVRVTTFHLAAGFSFAMTLLSSFLPWLTAYNVAFSLLDLYTMILGDYRILQMWPLGLSLWLYPVVLIVVVTSMWVQKALFASGALAILVSMFWIWGIEPLGRLLKMNVAHGYGVYVLFSGGIILVSTLFIKRLAEKRIIVRP